MSEQTYVCKQCKKPFVQQFKNQRCLCVGCITDIRHNRRQKALDRIKSAEYSQAAVVGVAKTFQDLHQTDLVYLLEDVKGSYKIGYTSNIEDRLRTFNTASSFPCTLIAVAPGSQQLERDLHRKFIQYRLSREWFARRVDILNEFKRLPNSLVFLEGLLAARCNSPAGVTATNGS